MKLKNLLIISAVIIFLFAGCNNKQPDSGNSDMTSGTVADNDEITAEDTEDINYAVDDNCFKDGFIFVYNGTTIYLGEYAENIQIKLGPAIDFYEYTEGCSSDVNSVVKMYMYDIFDIITYRKDENSKERISSIDVYEEIVLTSEGLHINGTVEEMISTYGEDYEERQSFVKVYRYAKGNTFLSFGVRNGLIISILYEVANIEDLNN